jgi:ubiquinone/menaquinone biosynthesis C-methylase UbiE
MPVANKTFLHVGCGPKQQHQRPQGFGGSDWAELRLDIDARVLPDIIGSMTNMSAVPDAAVDALYSSHNIEHLYPHEVPVALAEFLRVLKPAGFVVITCPDLRAVCALVANDKLTEAAYISPAGPITPLDILYGHRPPMAHGNLYMAHHCGFTEKVLSATLHHAGFASVVTACRPPPYFDLFALASKSAVAQGTLRELAAAHFPG